MPRTATPRPCAGFDYPKLRSWREARGLSRERVCADIGISVSLLGALEVGLRPPSVAVVIKLASYYGEEPGELLIGAGDTR